MTFTPAMSALIPGLLASRAAQEAMVTGRRYTADEAVAAGVVDAAADEADVLPDAIPRATDGLRPSRPADSAQGESGRVSVMADEQNRSETLDDEAQTDPNSADRTES